MSRKLARRRDCGQPRSSEISPQTPMVCSREHRSCVPAVRTVTALDTFVRQAKLLTSPKPEAVTTSGAIAFLNEILSCMSLLLSEDASGFSNVLALPYIQKQTPGRDAVQAKRGEAKPFPIRPGLCMYIDHIPLTLGRSPSH